MLLYNLLLCSGARCPHRELALLLLRRLLREPHARRHLHPHLDRSEPVSMLRTTWCNLFGQGFTSVGTPKCVLALFFGASLSAGPFFLRSDPVSRLRTTRCNLLARASPAWGNPECVLARHSTPLVFGAHQRGATPNVCPASLPTSIHKTHIRDCVGV